MFSTMYMAIVTCAECTQRERTVEKRWRVGGKREGKGEITTQLYQL